MRDHWLEFTVHWKEGDGDLQITHMQCYESEVIHTLNSLICRQSPDEITVFSISFVEPAMHEFPVLMEGRKPAVLAMPEPVLFQSELYATEVPF